MGLDIIGALVLQQQMRKRRAIPSIHKRSVAVLSAHNTMLEDSRGGTKGLL